MNILLVGGGTGGHIFPNLALIPLLKKHFDKIEYVGSDNKKDEKIVTRFQIPFHALPVVKLDRTKIFENFSIPQRLKKSVAMARKIIKDFKPDIIFLKGGFVSLPVAIASKKENIPCILHESDFSLGLSNKLSKRYVKKLLLSFEKNNKSKKCITTGAPIRDELLLAEKKRYFSNKKPILLAMGGSLGAREINNCIIDNLEQLCKIFNVIHITGDNKAKVEKRNDYLPLEFSNEMGSLLKSSDIVISRGGANSLFEILALKKPALILPLKKGSRGDQIENASYFEKKSVIKVFDPKKSFIENVISTYSCRIFLTHNIEKCDLSDGKERIINEILSSIR